MYPTKETSGELTWELLKYAAQHPVANNSDNNGHATEDDIKAFIRIFIRRSNRYDYSCSSYSLKHACERAIGYIFYGSNIYRYVSNEDFKKAMKELYFEEKEQSKDSPNMYYKFKWAPGALDVFDAFGVYGCCHHPSLKEVIKE